MFCLNSTASPEQEDYARSWIVSKLCTKKLAGWHQTRYTVTSWSEVFAK